MFTSGSFSFRRYRVAPPPHDWRERVLAGASAGAHVEQLRSRSADPNIGWVDAFDHTDTNFNLNKIVYGNYVVLGLRIDTKRLAPAFLRGQVQQRIEEVRRERGLELLARSHKREIAEAVEEELRARALPHVRLVPAAWDVHTNVLYVFTASDDLADHVVRHFINSFGMAAVPLRLCDTLGLPTGPADNDPLEGSQTAIAAELIEAIWRQEREGAATWQAGAAQCEACVEDNLVMQNPSQARNGLRLAGEFPTLQAEARAALTEGKLPREASLRLTVGDTSWRLTLKAAKGLQVTRIKLPCLVKDGLEEIVYERMCLLQRLCELLDELLRAHWRERNSEGWEARRQRWLESLAHADAA